jgi:hypothetical protein
MKDKLLKAYQDRQADFINILSKFPDDELPGPFLMSPNEIYNQQPNPLLVIGQETNGWEYHVDDLRKQMEHYEKFNVGISYYSSPFWNVTRKIECALGNQPYSCAWTNISKFDLNEGRPYGEYETAIATLDDILATEIHIIQPKVCIFFTSHHFDRRVKNIFPKIVFTEVEGFSLNQLSRLKHPDLPPLTFRTYHPRYLRISGLEEDFVEFIKGLSC